MYSDTEVSCSRDSNNHQKLKVELPEGAQIVEIVTQMANYPWVGGDVPCRADIPPALTWSNCPQIDGDCGIGWSKVRNVRVTARAGRQIVTADFHNWKHDNHRQARLLVYYKLGTPAICPATK
jgi:hypothetical protein